MDNMTLFLLALVIPALAQAYVSLTYSSERKRKNNAGVTGFDVARTILDKNGLNDIYIVKTGGKMSDHYDSARKTIRLSNEVYNGDSIAAAAIAAHECGHALQDKEGYLFMRIRSLIFPVVSLGTQLAYWVLLAGFLFEMMNLLLIAIVLVGLGLVFQIITLPVEFDATERAKTELEKYKLVDKNSYEGTKRMLRAAALTYVAGVLSSALDIVRLILVYMDRRD